MMRQFLKKITGPFLKLGLRLYYRKPRPYRYDGNEVVVHPEVFPPHLTLSTKILLDFIKPLALHGKTFLELGCGSGIISLYGAKKGAIVTATDINRIALEFLAKATKKNEVQVDIIYSDLFENLKDRHFDYIFINPPYYPKNPKTVKEQAWYCGEDYGYFEGLFIQLPSFLSVENKTYMILSEDCDISTIMGIAAKNGLSLRTILTKKIRGEFNYIYQVVR